MACILFSFLSRQLSSCALFRLRRFRIFWSGANTVIFFFIPDSFDTNRVRQKSQSIVFHPLRTQLREYLR
jgi:hypothetical protein